MEELLEHGVGIGAWGPWPVEGHRSEALVERGRGRYKYCGGSPLGSER